VDIYDVLNDIYILQLLEFRIQVRDSYIRVCPGRKIGSGSKICAGSGPGPRSGTDVGPGSDFGDQGPHVYRNLGNGYKIPAVIASPIYIHIYIYIYIYIKITTRRLG